MPDIMAEEPKHSIQRIYPLDSSPSPKEDLRSLAHLKTILEFNDDASSDEGQREKQNAILEELQCKIIQWSEDIVEKNLHTELKPLKVRQMMKLEHVQIEKFGSYALNVNHTDIDLLCFASRHITRKEFFETVFQQLKNDDAVKQPQKLVGAHVPLLKFTYQDLDIDLVFASLPKDNLDDVNIHDDALLEEINEESDLEMKDNKDILSLNGARVTHFLTNRVKNNVAFEVALQTIKTWARVRGIYSNQMGYLGGVSWAILVTKICQLFPNANAATVVRKFFFFYSRWTFGPERPISLLPASEQKERCSDPSRQDERSLMQIVTPVKPTKNTSYNVTNATFRLMLREFKRGDQLLNPESQGPVSEELWREFLTPSRFFFNYANYLLIKMGAQGGESNVYLWTNFIRTKIRNFVQTIERTTGSKATPFPECVKNPEGKYYFAIGIDISEEILAGSRKVNLARAVKQFVDVIYNRPSSRPYRSLNAQLYVFRKRRRELPEWVFKTDERPVDWKKPAEAGDAPQTPYQNRAMLPPNYASQI